MENQLHNVEELVQQALPSIIDGLKADIKQRITYQVVDDAAKIVSTHVQTWVKDNVLPEVTASLVESKQGFINLAPELANGMVTALRDALLAEFTRKMTQSWERSKIFEACFK